jgi:hypothetical protein
LDKWQVKFLSHLPGGEKLLQHDHASRPQSSQILEENHNKMFSLIDMLQGFSTLLDRMIAGNEIGADNRQNLVRYKVDILFVTGARLSGASSFHSHQFGDPDKGILP